MQCSETVLITHQGYLEVWGYFELETWCRSNVWPPPLRPPGSKLFKMEILQNVKQILEIHCPWCPFFTSVTHFYSIRHSVWVLPSSTMLSWLYLQLMYVILTSLKTGFTSWSSATSLASLLLPNTKLPETSGALNGTRRTPLMMSLVGGWFEG